MDAQFGQGYGLVLGTVLLAVVAFWVAFLMRRAGARQDTEDSGHADHGSENTDVDDGADDASEDDAVAPDAAAASPSDGIQAQRMEQARQKFEQQLSAIDLDLDALPAEADVPAAGRSGKSGERR